MCVCLLSDKRLEPICLAEAIQMLNMYQLTLNAFHEHENWGIGCDGMGLTTRLFIVNVDYLKNINCLYKLHFVSILGL